MKYDSDTAQYANIMMDHIICFARTYPEIITNPESLSEKCNDFYKDQAFTVNNLSDFITDICNFSTTLPPFFSQENFIFRRFSAVFLDDLNCHQKNLQIRLFLSTQKDGEHNNLWTEEDADNIYADCMSAHYPCIKDPDDSEPIQSEIDLEKLYQSDTKARNEIYNKVVLFLLAKMQDQMNAQISDIFMNFDIFHNSWIILLRRTFNDHDFLSRAFKEIPSLIFLKLFSPALSLYLNTISTDSESAFNQLISEFFPNHLIDSSTSKVNCLNSNEIIIELLRAYCDRPPTQFQIPSFFEEKAVIVDVFLDRVRNGNISFANTLYGLKGSSLVVLMQIISQRCQ